MGKSAVDNERNTSIPIYRAIDVDDDFYRAVNR